jgi:hypothetical protein
MLIFPSMLCTAAREAGIPVPPSDVLDDPDQFKETHPQFFVLCATQLQRPMSRGEHFENARALAKIPLELLPRMTMGDLQEAGVHCGI